LHSSTFIYLTSVFFISYSIMQVPGGIFLDKYGIRKILPIFIGLTSIGVMLFWYSSNSYMILASRFIAGIGCSIGYIASIYVAAKFFSPRRLPMLIGIIEAASEIGTLSAANPLTYLIERFGWSLVGVFISAFCVLLCILAVICMKQLANYPQEVAPKTTFMEYIKNIPIMLKNKTLLALFVYSFSTWLVIMSFAGFWLNSYLQTMHHYSAITSLHCIQIYWISFIISSIMIGFFIKSGKFAKMALIFLALLGFSAYSYMFIPILFDYSNILLVIISGGISAAGVTIAFSLIPHFVKPEQCGSAIALNNTFIVLGGYTGQVLFATLLQKFDVNDYIHIVGDSHINHHYYSALIIYVFFTLVGLIAALTITFSKEPIVN